MLYDVTNRALHTAYVCTKDNGSLTSQPVFLQENAHSLQHHFSGMIIFKTLILPSMQWFLFSGVNTDNTTRTLACASQCFLITYVITKIYNTHSFMILARITHIKYFTHMYCLFYNTITSTSSVNTKEQCIYQKNTKIIPQNYSL
jgi:hypothetical protein